MEWQAIKGTEKISAVVPDDYIDKLLEVLAPTAVAIDPYRDSTVPYDNLNDIITALETAMNARRQILDHQLKRQFKQQFKQQHLRELPAWSEPARTSLYQKDAFLQTLSKLLDVCHFSHQHRCALNLLGQ